MSLGEDIVSIREDIKLYTKLSGEDASQETIATIGAYLRGYRQGKEDAEPHWIPVTERLPEKLDYYLVSGNNSVWLAGYESGRFLGVLSGYALDTVIAWMPLPEPYKGVTT